MHSHCQPQHQQLVQQLVNVNRSVELLMPILDKRHATRLQLPNAGRDLSDDQRANFPPLGRSYEVAPWQPTWPAGTVVQASGSYSTLLTAIRRQAMRRWLRRARTCPSCSSASVARSICMG